MIRRRTSRHATPDFTLIELLVVVAIISLLISTLLPSIKAAREEAKAVVCMSNQRQVYLASCMYQGEEKGFLPNNVWSEEAWWIDKADLWFYKLVPDYAQDPDVLICPGDPFADTFDFDAVHPRRHTMHNDARKASCGYGMNYVFRHFGGDDRLLGFNVEMFPPSRPECTILFAEVGPDEQPVRDGFYQPGENTTGLCKPWRDGGRLVWDDGQRDWYDNYTWLTARHRGGINVMALDGNVKRVWTLDMVNQHRGSGLQKYYEKCASGDCYFCNYHPPYDDKYHYNFSDAGLYWWTGKIPAYPR